MAEPVKGKGGTYYPPFPVLGLASDGQEVFMTGGGGGASSYKEVPNLVQAHRYVEETGKLSTIASLNCEKMVVINLSYCTATRLWYASSQAGCKVLQLNEEANTLTEVCTWSTEKEGKEPTQNVVKCSPTGDVLATAGTDGVLRLWRAGKPEIEPTLLHECEKTKEISDLDFSPDGTMVATCDRGGACRLWDVAKGTGTSTIFYEISKPQKQQLAARSARFVAEARGVSPALVIAGSGPRGPACLGLFALDGSKLDEVFVDSKPLTAMAVDESGEFAAVNLATGAKKVYSLSNMRCVVAKKDVHELPAPCAAFVGQSTVVSGSGDRCINLLTFKKGSGGAGVVSLYCILVMIIILGIVYLIGNLGIKGAALKQGH